MKMNNRLLVILIPLLTGLLCAAYVALIHWQKTHFSCDSQLTVVSEKGAEDVILHFNFAGSSGHIDIRGEYTSKAGEVIPTSNKIDFTFWREDNALIMISNETNRLPMHNPLVLDNAPDFFSSRERGIRFNVVEKNPGGYMFLYENAPGLYCARSE